MYNLKREVLYVWSNKCRNHNKLEFCGLRRFAWLSTRGYCFWKHRYRGWLSVVFAGTRRHALSCTCNHIITDVRYAFARSLSRTAPGTVTMARVFVASSWQPLLRHYSCLESVRSLIPGYQSFTLCKGLVPVLCVPLRCYVTRFRQRAMSRLPFFQALSPVTKSLTLNYSIHDFYKYLCGLFISYFFIKYTKHISNFEYNWKFFQQKEINITIVARYSQTIFN